MCVHNLVPIGPQATCIPSEGYTHTQTDTHTLSYIDIDSMPFGYARDVFLIKCSWLECSLVSPPHSSLFII